MTGDPGLSEFLLVVFLSTPIGVAAYMFWLAWTRGGDPQQEAVSVQYEPPNDLTPAECGTLVDNAVELRSITATITDLSVKGYITIEQKQGASSGDRPNYVFHLTKPLSDWNNLKTHEREVLTTIFVPNNPLLLLSQAMERVENTRKGIANQSALWSALSRCVEAKAKELSDECAAHAGPEDGPRDSATISDVQDHFSLHLQRIRDAIFDRLVAGGYYAQRPDHIRMLYAVGGVFIALVMAAIGWILALSTKAAPLALILIGVLSGAIILGFGFFMPARTNAGAQTFTRLLGFREFLSRVEKDHIERLEKTPDLFEKYLPYAMALTVENRWTQAFANIAVTAPHWYQRDGRDAFLPMHLTSDLSQMTNPQLGLLHTDGQ